MLNKLDHSDLPFDVRRSRTNRNAKCCLCFLLEDVLYAHLHWRVPRRRLFMQLYRIARAVYSGRTRQYSGHSSLVSRDFGEMCTTPGRKAPEKTVHLLRNQERVHSDVLRNVHLNHTMSSLETKSEDQN